MTPLQLTPAQDLIDRLVHRHRHDPPKLRDRGADERMIYRVALEKIRDLDVDAPYDYAAFAEEMQRIASIALDTPSWFSVTPHCSMCVADAERVAHCPRCDGALIHERIDTGHGNRIEGEACPGCGWSYEPELDTSRKDTP